MDHGRERGGRGLTSLSVRPLPCGSQDRTCRTGAGLFSREFLGSALSSPLLFTLMFEFIY